eukprot:Tamp_01773.p1 GENE.Tamp_01773~~Tamp_01773.p1  ORF type:complete len:978 (-),score=217.46 Tamp_01773:562-3495(-)
MPAQSSAQTPAQMPGNMLPHQQQGQMPTSISMPQGGHAHMMQQQQVPHPPAQQQPQQPQPQSQQQQQQQQAGGQGAHTDAPNGGMQDSEEDELVIVGCSGTFSADLPHARAHCVNRPHRIVKDRVGVEGDNNEQYCPNCFCYVCDVKASQCHGWLRVGHCHAHDKDPYWRALREFTRIEMLSSSPLLPALACDEAAQMEAHRWCVNGLLAFHRYRDGDPGPDGVYNHSFQHVTDVASSAMKAIVGHLSGPKGPRTTLAVLDGITSSIVVNTWRPLALQDAKHKWCKGTYAAYKAIIEQLEKYWVLAIVHTSTRSVPPLALAIMSHRLKRLSKLATREVAGGIPQMSHVPLTHAVSACERGWTHPVVVAILEGVCREMSQREAQTLQRARLHVLERAGRWKEAYHYAIFHGHVAKSLVYMVRAGRHAEVLPMVYLQSEMVRGGKCVPVCAELASCQQSNTAIRLAMYCAFGDYDKETTDSEQLVQNRMPYVQWLVEHVAAQLTPEEVKLRRQHGKASGLVEAARRDAEEWARQVAEDLPNALRNAMPDPPVGALYSAGMYTVERLAALCAIANPMLALNCAKVLSRQGDHFGAASVVLAMGSRSHSGQASDDSHALIVWALQELVPKLGMQSLEPALQSLQPDKIPPQMQMAVANALLTANEVTEAVKWAKSASLVGAPEADKLPFAAFQDSRQFRPCDLQAFIDAAGRAQDSASALLLAELQMWWEPSWEHLQAMERLCSPQKFGLRRQQLQSLALNDSSCRTEMRFDVLVREGMHQQATGILVTAARDNAQTAHEALRKGLEGLGQSVVAQASEQSPGLMESLMPWLDQLVPSCETIDPAMELLAQWMPQRVLPMFDLHVNNMRDMCKNTAVNPTIKTNLRSWLMRTRRMYYAAGQAEAWEKRFADLTSTLKRKSSLSSVWADLGAPGGGGGSGLGSKPATPHSQMEGGSASAAPTVATPAGGGGGAMGSGPGTPA